MKKLTTLVLSLLFLCSCKETPKDHFNVTGKITDFEKGTILALTADNGYSIDTISVIDYKFQYSGKVEKPVMTILYVKTDSTTTEFTEFMLENAEIEIEGSLMDFDSFTIKGSQSDEILKRYLKEDGVLVQKWNSLKLEYDEAILIGDTLKSKELGNNLNNILLNDRVGLLKSYVKENYNNQVGALLPNFCTLKEFLTSEDYLQMYQSLSVDVQKSWYGQSVKSKSEKK